MTQDNNSMSEMSQDEDLVLMVLQKPSNQTNYSLIMNDLYVNSCGHFENDLHFPGGSLEISGDKASKRIVT